MAPKITSAVGRTGRRSSPSIERVFRVRPRLATAALCMRSAPLEDRVDPIGQGSDGRNRVALELDALGREPVRPQRLEIAGGLRGDQRPERVAGAGDVRVALGCADELQEASGRRAALVQLAGRVQETRPYPNVVAAPVAARIAVRNSAIAASRLLGRRQVAHDRHVVRRPGVGQQRPQLRRRPPRRPKGPSRLRAREPCCPWPPARWAGRTG